MADNDSGRRRPDLVTLSAGLLALAVSFYVTFGGLEGLRINWVLGLGAVCVGVIMLAASLRPHDDS